MKKQYRPFYIVSLILSIFWIVTLGISFIESLVIGYQVANIPSTFCRVYFFIDALSSSEEVNWSSLFISILYMPVVLPFMAFIFVITFFIVGVSMVAIIGAFYLLGFIVDLISIVLVVISLVFAILAIVASAKGLKKEPKSFKFSKIIGILALVSLIVAWAPSMFSLVSIFRCILIIVIGVMLIIGSKRGVKFIQEGRQVI